MQKTANFAPSILLEPELMTYLKKQRVALLLTQAELSEITGAPQTSIAGAEAGADGHTAFQLKAALSNPDLALLKNLIRLAKFRRIFKALSAENQTHFAELSGMTQGAISVFLRGRRRFTDARWYALMDRLCIEEPETESDDIAEAQIILAQNRDDEGFQLQSELEARNVKLKDFAEMLGISAPALSQYFATARFGKDTRARIDRAIKSLE